MNYLYNRELSWLDFNLRVLNEANNERNPLFERLRFLSIVHSNLDEFFMIRVGGLNDQKIISPKLVDTKTHWSAEKQLDEIAQSVKNLYKTIHEVQFNLLKEFEKNNISILDPKTITTSDLMILEESFDRDIQSLLSIQIIDPKHPFPQLLNKEVYVLLELERKNKKELAVVTLNSNRLKTLYQIPTKKRLKFIQTEDIVYLFVDKIFKEWKVLSKGLLRVTRNADINLDESEELVFDDYRLAMKKLIKKRSRLAAVRIEIRYELNDSIISYLRKLLDLPENFIFKLNSINNYNFMGTLEENLRVHSLTHYFYAKNESIKRFINKDSILQTVLSEDILIATPYESFSTYLMLLNEAARDPLVYSISITLYRIASESRVLQELILAAENGKDVTVIFELKARFDETNNIEWSSQLEEAGIRVIYGVQDLKIHAKVTLIKRKDGRNFQFISHIGTGNYNEKTSRLYTDFHLLSANSLIAKEVNDLFQLIMTNTMDNSFNFSYLLVAPHHLKQNLIKLIEQEIDYQNRFKNGLIILKFNSLTDLQLIEALVKASQAGVQIKMIVRGISCLIPQIKGFTENIEIRSIIGKYLEHSRYYYFHHNQKEKIYISSADWMTRNMDRRIEVAVPILDLNNKSKIKQIINLHFKDSDNTWLFNENHQYIKPLSNTKINVHQDLFTHLDKIEYKQKNVNDKSINIFQKILSTFIQK